MARLFEKNTGPEVVITETTVVKGNISTKSAIRIEGQIVGNVSSENDVLVNMFGKVEGEVVCNDLTIAGSVRGNIYAKGLLTVHENAELVGDSTATSIHVEPGANYQGKFEILHPEKQNNKNVKPAKKKEQPKKAKEESDG